MKFTLALLALCALPSALGHGSMINPRPRSAHNQVFDSRNRCGCQDRPGGCYSNATAEGNYCGLGCIGESCLYYQIGCFQGCGSCSLVGKTLYPVPADLTAAGCSLDVPPPTLGGGDSEHEHELRTYNIDNDSRREDWTKWNPWRSPGTAGKGNPEFRPCGVNSGSSTAFPDPPAHGQAKAAPGGELPALPESSRTTWTAGSIVEAEWSIYANHGGGYSYRLCKAVEGEQATEECYQRTPLDFATDTTEIRYYDGHTDSQGRSSFLINATTTNVGTWPTGSQWRKNPIPMCNCDIGENCASSGQLVEDKLSFHARQMIRDPSYAALADDGKQCKNTLREQCGTKSGVNTCLKCGSNSAYDCEECCPGLTKVTKGEYTYCTSGKSACSDDNPQGCFSIPYENTYLAPGQTAERCPTGLMFPSQWDEGYGNAQPLGSFMWSMVDKLVVPEDLEPGQYSLSWRWDCEQTPQVWNSCADITIEAKDDDEQIDEDENRMNEVDDEEQVQEDEEQMNKDGEEGIVDKVEDVLEAVLEKVKDMVVSSESNDDDEDEGSDGEL